MALTIAECFDKGVEVFRDRLQTAPHLPDSFIDWFDNDQDFDIPDFLSHKKPSELLELAGDASMSKQLLIWFDSLTPAQQKTEAMQDIEALLEDNGHI